MKAMRRGRGRTGLTLVEIALSAAVLAFVLLAAVGLMVRSHRELSRTEDLVHFQGEANRVADELTRWDFRRLAAEASLPTNPKPMFSAVLYQMVRNLNSKAQVDGWITVVDPRAVMLTVEVRWTDPDRAGRAIAASTRVHRLVVRHDASLDLPVAMGGINS